MRRTYLIVVFLLLFSSTVLAQTEACDKLGFIIKQGEQFKLTTAVEYLIKGGAVLDAYSDGINKQDSFYTFDKLFYFNPARTLVTCSKDSVVFSEQGVVSSSDFYTKRLLLRFLDGSSTLESVTLETRRQYSGTLERWAVRLRHVPYSPGEDWIALYNPTYPSTIAYLDFDYEQLFNQPRRMVIKHLTDSLDWVIGVRTTTAGVDAAAALSGVSCRYHNGSVYLSIPEHSKASLVISDVLGRTRLSLEIQNQETTLPLRLERGNYFARVVIKGTPTMIPLVVQ